MPITLPARPTLTPLNVRKPRLGHRKQADDAAANRCRRVKLHQRLRHRVERQLEEAGGEQQREGQRVDADHAKLASAQHHSIARTTGGARSAASAALGFPGRSPRSTRPPRRRRAACCRTGRDRRGRDRTRTPASAPDTQLPTKNEAAPASSVIDTIGGCRRRRERCVTISANPQHGTRGRLSPGGSVAVRAPATATQSAAGRAAR